MTTPASPRGDLAAAGPARRAGAVVPSRRLRARDRPDTVAPADVIVPPGRAPGPGRPAGRPLGVGPAGRDGWAR